MSHHKKYHKHHTKSGHGGQMMVPAEDHLVLQVLRQAEKDGAKVGYKIASKALKYARKDAIALSEERIQELYAAAQRAGAAAAVQSARKLLQKNLGYRMPSDALGSTASAPDSTVDPREAPGTEQISAVPQPIKLLGAKHLQGMGQHVLRIKRLQRLSPEMLRIVAGAPSLDGFRPNARADQYVKVYFSDPALSLEPPYDLQALRRRLPRHQVPRSRSYTIRWIDPGTEELAIDFVLHKDPGSAGAWAANAQVGDALVISAARGKFSPPPQAEYFILAADEAGIPAISSALAQLPTQARGVALLEVAGMQSEFDIPHPAGVQIRWLHREGIPAGTSTLLPQTLQQLPRPPQNTSVMAHAERGTSRQMSDIVSDWNLDKKSVHISSYWTLRPAKSRN